MKKQESFPNALPKLSDQEETNISEDPTKKLFGFRMKMKLHLFRSMEKIFSVADEIQERFGVSRTVLLNQLCKKIFLDSQEKSHEVELSPSLEKFLMRATVANGFLRVMAENKSMIDEFQNLF